MHKWGWRRFERMFKLHLLRKAKEELRQMRDLRIAVLDANTNYDSEENRRAKENRVEGIRDGFNRCVEILYSDKPQETEADAMEEDPLFAPIRKRTGELAHEINRPLAPQAGMGRDLLEAQP